MYPNQRHLCSHEHQSAILVLPGVYREGFQEIFLTVNVREREAEKFLTVNIRGRDAEMGLEIRV